MEMWPARSGVRTVPNKLPAIVCISIRTKNGDTVFSYRLKRLCITQPDNMKVDGFIEEVQALLRAAFWYEVSITAYNLNVSSKYFGNVLKFVS